MNGRGTETPGSVFPGILKQKKHGGAWERQGRLIRTQLNRVLGKEYLNRSLKQPERGRKDDNQEFQGLI